MQNTLQFDHRKFKDLFASKVMVTLCIFVLLLAFFMALSLFLRSKPVFLISSLSDIIFSNVWQPSLGKFGLAGFITGTFWVTIVAMLIAVPLSILTAIYLAEYVPGKIRETAKPLIDLLAGLSPVIYGVWGVLIVVPFVGNYVMPFFSEKFPWFPFVSENFTGYSILSGGVVLAIMVLPIIISVIFEVIRSIPLEVREASLALGATKWQTIRRSLLKIAMPGVVAAVILGLSRALGETMAVLMVTGCSLGVFPKSVFDTAYPLPALIANTYGEMMSVPLYDSAILLAALFLLLITMAFNMVGWGILLKIKNGVILNG